MPIERKCLPGNRNTATSIQDNNKRGWFASLSPQDQELLNDPFLSLTVARENIPEDYNNGLTREEIIQFDNDIRPIDITNCDMFRNQNNDILSFMNCIYNNPSRVSVTPISHPNFVAGFSNFETEVNQNSNNNSNTRNNNTNNDTNHDSSTVSHHNHNCTSSSNTRNNNTNTDTNQDSLTVSHHNHNRTSSSHAKGRNYQDRKSTNKHTTISTNSAKQSSWSDFATKTKSTDQQAAQSNWGSFTRNNTSTWGNSSKSITATPKISTSKTTSILKPSSIPITNNDWFNSFSVIVEEGVWNDNINPFMSFIKSTTYNKELYSQHILFSDFEQNIQKIINQFNDSSENRKDTKEIKEIGNFVNQVVFHNPVWDFGFQVATIKKMKRIYFIP